MVIRAVKSAAKADESMVQIGWPRPGHLGLSANVGISPVDEQ
jgi:hypothetical protein